MKFEQFVVASEAGPTDNPASAICRHIIAHAKDLAMIGVQVQYPGRKYEDFGRAWSVEYDEEASERDLKEGARDLANAIVEACGDAQEDSDKTLRWLVSGYNEPNNGKPEALFTEKFRVSGRIRQPTRKETTEDVITGTNQTLRMVYEDAHRNYMDIAQLLLKTIKPVSEMAGNLAEKIRPSDAEVASRVREFELNLEADIAKAEAINKRAASQARMDTLKSIFGEVDINSILEQIAQLAMFRAQQGTNEDNPNATSDPSASPGATPGASTSPPRQATVTQVPPDTDHLCESSRTLAEIIYGREEAIAAELGDRWKSIAPLARQTDEAEFSRLAKALYEDLSQLGKLEQAQLFTSLNKGLGDPERMKRLGSFLKKSGIFG